jgi:hypothetical protein
MNSWYFVQKEFRNSLIDYAKQYMAPICIDEYLEHCKIYTLDDIIQLMSDEGESDINVFLKFF